MREFYDLKENNNKDLIIKFERDTVEKCQKDLMGTIADVLWQADCYFVGEPFSFGNYMTAIYIYNYNADVYYIATYNDLYDMGDGEKVVLTANEADEDIRELLD